MVWLGDDVVRWWCGQVMVWAGDGWIWSELFCRGHGQPDEAEWWVQNIEMNRMSLSANPMCRWLPLDRKKGARVRKHVDPEESRESTESKPLFLILFKPRGKQRAASSNFLWTGASAERAEPLPLTSWSHAQSSWPSSCPVRSSSRLRRRKATWMSGSLQSCSRLAAVTECHQLREHHSHTLPTS